MLTYILLIFITFIIICLIHNNTKSIEQFKKLHKLRKKKWKVKSPIKLNRPANKFRDNFVSDLQKMRLINKKKTKKSKPRKIPKYLNQKFNDDDYSIDPSPYTINKSFMDLENEHSKLYNINNKMFNEIKNIR